MSVQSLGWGRYSELRPEQLVELRRQAPVAYVPWGALDWHGSHLPLGASGTIAEAIAERSARRTGGVLLPTGWWSAGGRSSPGSLPMPVAHVSAAWDALFAGLARNEWRVVVIVNGVYHPAHDLALMDAAEDAIRRYNLLVLAVPPLAMVDEEMLDRGGIWETSLLTALRPDQVNSDAIGPEPFNPAAHGILGRDPRGTASASIGTSTITLAVERLSSAVGQLLAEQSSEPLKVLYERRRERYRALLARYGNNLDQLSRAWWGEETEK
ncbi:MAG: creatininase family protein [Oscillochloris sp.]|nr:creatininase family protein [Oscillochloris sp.]